MLARSAEAGRNVLKHETDIMDSKGNDPRTGEQTPSTLGDHEADQEMCNMIYAIFTTYSPLRATHMPFLTMKHSIQCVPAYAVPSS